MRLCPRIPRWLPLLVVLALGALCAAEDQAQLAPAQPETKTVRITSISQFWSISAEERASKLPFSLDCWVTYYDHDWKHLWIQDASGAAFVSYGELPLPLQAGQRIHAEGWTKDQNLNFEGAAITITGLSSPPVEQINDSVSKAAKYNDRLVSVEAMVDRQEVFAGGHLHLFLSIEGKQAYAWVLLKPGQSPPNLASTHVRMTGIYTGQTNPSGELSNLEFRITGTEQIEVISTLTKDTRFKGEAIPIAGLAKVPSNSLVLIRGRVIAQDSGRSLTLRDETGQIVLQSAQTISCPVNSQVEAIGYPFIAGISWQLRSATYRPLTNKTSATETSPKRIYLAAQLAELPPDQAAMGLPAFLSGVVTWSHPEAPFFFIQDSSGAACILRGENTGIVRPPGRNVEVTGVTALGDFAPVITASKITKTGDLILPEAKQISYEHAMSGLAEATWVEMRGYLRRIHTEETWIRLEMAGIGGDFNALLPPSSQLPPLTGAILRIQGVCSAQTNERRQIRGVRLWVPGANNIQIEENAPSDPFNVPQRTLRSIGQFGAPLSSMTRVRLSGIVLHKTPGNVLYLYEQGESIQVYANDVSVFNAGDLIHASGFLSRRNNRIVLREALCKKVGTSPLPSPIAFSEDTLLKESLDGLPVALTAQLAEAMPLKRDTRLTLTYKGTLFDAIVQNTDAEEIRQLCPVGATVRLQGIYEVRFDAGGKPSVAILRVRGIEDIAVLGTPSWLTRDRIIGVSVTLLVSTLLIATWVLALRRRVKRQTEQILKQITREAQLQGELQRATKLESLGLLAGGIAHDFNNLLTVIMGNLSLCATEENLSDDMRTSLGDATNAVTRAKDLTQQLLTFAKGGTPVRASLMLPDIVHEVAQFSTRGSKVACEYDFAEDLSPANVDKGQISQVVQNITINAIQAMNNGGTIRYTLRNDQVGEQFGPMLAEGSYVKLTIADNGPGIPHDHLAKIFDPYFTTKKSGVGIGLATVHSIVRKHFGHISVESKIGVGTSFHIWLPTADSMAEPAELETTTPLPQLKGHVLIMDDEPEVRRLASSILKRIGLQSTTASEGEEAILLYEESVKAGTPYDLLLLDLTVPGGMGGIQVMERLGRTYPGVKAIVSSGYSSELKSGNYQDYGFVDVVPKPYQMSDLAKALSRVLS